MKLILPLILIAWSGNAQSSILGKWKTVDESGGEKSIIEIFERDGKAYGRIVKIFTTENPDPICDKCPEDDLRYRKRIIGMEIIKDMQLIGDEYSGGSILDPEEGKIYRGKLWLEEGGLKVRGYWGPFYRTQLWSKAH
jgi:uncharacterized protein (DUF2147 family)